MARKNKRGVLGIEIGIAVAIFTVFSTILLSSRANLNVKLEELEMRSNATKIAVQSVEKTLLEDYDTINNKEEKVFEKNKEYLVNYSIEKYSDTKPNKEDLVKVLTVTVNYNVRGNNKNYTVSTLVTRK